MDEWPVIGMDHLAMRMIQPRITQNQSANGFDPYQAMLKRKQSATEDAGGYINTPVQQYDTKDIQEVEDFCRKYGIMGFNFGKMNPKAALQMLKNKMGIINEKSSNKKMLLD